MFRLQTLRLSRGLSQKRLAALTKGLVNQNIISAIERGRVNPTPAELKVLSSVLGCPADRLLDHIDECAFLPVGTEYRIDGGRVRS